MITKTLFSKKHYDALAKVIGQCPSAGAWMLTQAIENLLARDNKKFDRVKFRNAVKQVHTEMENVI